MLLNLAQQKAIESGEPVALNVAGIDCILVRKDIYLRLDPDFDTGSWTIEEINLLADEAEALISRSEDCCGTDSLCLETVPQLGSEN